MEIQISKYIERSRDGKIYLHDLILKTKEIVGLFEVLPDYEITIPFIDKNNKIKYKKKVLFYELKQNCGD